MTKEKIIEAVSIYEAKLNGLGYESEQDIESASFTHRMGHVLWMCDEVRDLVAEDRLEKAFRWLGFIQGALWSATLYSIEELKQHTSDDV